MIDITFKNKIPPRKGRILISDPFLGDDYFERSVVYLCEHNQEGSFGFVLNNLVEINLNDLNDQFPAITTKISTGGPVETESMFFVHTLGDQLNESLEISHGIFVGGDFEQLYLKIEEKHIQENEIRFFLGYSGWSKGQLESEIKENAWVVSEIDVCKEIMQIQETDTWKYFMSKLGSKYQFMTNFPIDPNEN
jgi:putative transcriptional regulator